MRDDPRVVEGRRKLFDLGCSTEQAGARWFALDVPPGVDAYTARETMEQIEKSGLWGFEEDHCGHRAN